MKNMRQKQVHQSFDSAICDTKKLKLDRKRKKENQMNGSNHHHTKIGILHLQFKEESIHIAIHSLNNKSNI